MNESTSDTRILALHERVQRWVSARGIIRACYREKLDAEVLFR
jgi:hypothetical protein